jgi:uncharacterized protein (DUF1501 family)
MGKHHISRRKFVQQASCAAIGSTTLFSTLANLKSLGQATAHNTSLFMGGGDYKAMVCILLSGGNDSFNMLAPKGSEYSEYALTRSNLAVPENELIDLNQAAGNHSGRSFGLHPNMPNMAALFNNSTAAARHGTEDANVSFISNIGSLVDVITKQQFYDGSVPTPLGLYSHSDQQMHWQTGIPNERVAQGWAGKIADLLSPNNNAYNDIALNISLSGTNVFQTGDSTVEYAVDAEQGSIGISGYGGSWILDQMKTQKVNNMIDYNYQDMFKQAYVDPVASGVRGDIKFTQALNNTPPLNTVFTYHDDGWQRIGQSFEMIAKTIAARDHIGVDRQIFFLDFGGWDHHDSLLDQHPQMLGRLDQSLMDFNNAMKELGVQDCVTTFCLSEFSRTLTSNGDGSDHAWGGNVFMMGGAVNGRKIYGNYPSLVLDNPLEVGGGSLIPTTSCDEYFAELAMWFGVPNSDLTLLYPNLGNFYSVGSGNPIGFMHL